MEKIKEAKLIIIGNDKNNTIIEEEGNYSIVNLTNEKKRINILENDEIIESYILFSLKTCFIKINSNKVININEEDLDNKYNDTIIKKIDILRYVKRKNDKSKNKSTRIGILVYGIDKYKNIYFKYKLNIGIWIPKLIKFNPSNSIYTVYKEIWKDSRREKIVFQNEYNLDKFVKSQKLDIKIFNAVFNKVIKCVNELKYEDKSLQTDDYISD